MTLTEIHSAETEELKKRHKKLKRSINYDDCVEALLIEKELQARSNHAAETA